MSAKITLTDLAIKKLPEGIYWDAATPAFGVRIGKNRKTFITVKNGSKQALGHYPRLSLAEARKRASEGILDPVETMLEALQDFERVYGPEVSPRTMKDWQRLITKHFTSLHTKPLNIITLRDISKVLEDMKDTPQEANHAHAAVMRFFNWCASTGRLQHTLRLPTPYKKKSRERVLSLDEIARVWTTCSTNTPFHLIVRLLILTGQRRGEIANIHLCKLASDTSQTNALVQLVTWPTTKNGKPHTIPCTLHTMMVVQQLLKVSNSTSHNTWSKPKAALDKASGVTNWTLHDLRRSMATHMAEQLKIAPHVIERILNHTQQGVAGIYNRAQYMEEMREALEKWEALVLSL